MTSTCDFLVIGGGMAGASAAYNLAGKGKTVLLEMESQPGYHTTGRSAALYTEGYGNFVIRAITKASRPFFDAPPPGFAEGPLLSKRGTLLVATEDILDKLDEIEEEVSPLIDELYMLEGADLNALAPYLDPDVVTRGLYEPAAMDMDVNAIHQGFLKGLRAGGGEVVTGAEVTVLTRQNDVWRVETNSGTYETQTVVNAAGAWADQVAHLAGAKPIGLMPKRRSAFTFDAPDHLDVDALPAVIKADETWYVKPEAGKLLGSPADETLSEPCDAQPEELDLAIAVDRIQTHTRLEIHRFESKWAGLRSFVKDKTPVVGTRPGEDGFCWCAGQGGYGIQTSAGMGQITAALAAGEDMPKAIAALGVSAKDLAPDRASLS